MKKSILFIAFFVTLTMGINAQVTVQQTATIEEYVNELIIGVGINASNITFTGSEIQLGHLLDGQGTEFPIDQGVILSTADALNCVINNDIYDDDDVPFGEGIMGDSSLLSIANLVPSLIGQSFIVTSVNDVCILEFDFVVTGNYLSFNYSFGSDEYLTWVNSSYNDVFAFLLSGPGIEGEYSSPVGFPDGAVNLAYVPETDPQLPITVSSINDVTNNQYYIDNSEIDNIGLNGFTTMIQASHIVIDGESYHIKLAIADGSDNALESVVVLETNSFMAMYGNPNDIDENESEELLVFPNPASKSFNITFHNTIKNPFISIVDSQGKIVYHSIPENNNNLNISIDFLVSGIYFIQLIEHGEIIEIKKLVIEK